MPFRRRSRLSRGGSSRPIRNREWITWTSSLASGYSVPNMIELAPTNLANAWIVTPEECRDEWDEPTVVRSLIRFHARPVGSTAALGGTWDATIRGGLIVWKGNVNGPPGLTSLDDLDPNDGSLDWLWWDEIHMEHTTGDLLFNDGIESEATPQGGRIDIRAKRKMELGFGLAGAFVNVAASSINVRMFFSGRALLLNH